eukprot:TRINITY_DN74442_c0_g1_i1.p1 TRINITY_DN74442_c0_g1~~TRINITY_DN74442_c0_g1_i1.p1  ORF type:complete len:664 (+),score=66.55 TRINITY_DN74442_c0_g1_i1:71-2062(+)
MARSVGVGMPFHAPVFDCIPAPSALTAIEVALEAWAECGPVGFTLPETRAISLLFTFGAHIPGKSNGIGSRAKVLEALLPTVSAAGGTHVGLGSVGGKVHFLYFWRAFGSIVRAVWECGEETVASSETDVADGGPIFELESVRDAVLAFLQASENGWSPVPRSVLTEAVQSVSSTSVVREFWRAVSDSCTTGKDADTTAEVSIEELTVMLLSWLHDAVMWQHAPGVNAGPSMCGDSAVDEVPPPPLPQSRPSTAEVVMQRSRTLSSTTIGTWRPGTRSRAESGHYSMMTSTALVIDLEEHWRAAGFLDGTDSGAAMSITAISSRSGRTHAGMFDEFARRSVQEEATSARTLTPRKTPSSSASSRADAGSESPRQPPPPCHARLPLPAMPVEATENGTAPCGQPPELPIMNIRTAMMPLNSTPHPPPEPGGVAASFAVNLRSAMVVFDETMPPGALRTRPHSRTAMLPLSPPRSADIAGHQRSRSTSERRSPKHHSPHYFHHADDDQRPEGLPVFLHIYDVSQEATIRRLNSVFAHRRSPLKFGGVFHAGVEVAGTEWSFGHTQSNCTGVVSVKPREAPNHHFRETVELRRTHLQPDVISAVIEELKAEYMGPEYNLLRRNCCHFADDLCQRLGVGRIPGWVYRLARIGARVDAVLLRPGSRST